ncbi:MAG: UTP--glucose-1-phosphate uridylyltransferase GalU [Candidatus Dormibacteraceae bacterium]
MRLVIPAGGRGSRFGKATQTLPKEMLLLGGKPLIHHALDEAARAGMEEAVIVLAPWKVAISDYLEGVDLPLPVRYAQQPEPLGIGDAVLRAELQAPFGLLLPDDVITTLEPWPELLAAHAKSGAAVMTVRAVPTEETSRFGIAVVEAGMVVDLVEKPAAGTARSNLAVFGRYIVNGSVLAGIAGPGRTGEMEITDAFRVAALGVPGVAAVEYDGVIFDCGTPAEFARAQAAYLAAG